MFFPSLIPGSAVYNTIVWAEHHRCLDYITLFLSVC